jgi:hypothetical protein
MPLPVHRLRVGAVERELQPGQVDLERELRDIEPLLFAVFQSEHLSLLVGSGLPVAVAAMGGARPAAMSVPDFNVDGQDLVLKRASTLATRSSRGEPTWVDIATDWTRGPADADPGAADHRVPTETGELSDTRLDHPEGAL